MYASLLERCSLGFILPVLEYCSAVWCSAADTHFKLLDSVVSDASFLTVGVLSVALHTVAVVCCSSMYATAYIHTTDLWQ